MSGVDGTAAYMKRQDEGLPHYKILLEGGNFFIGDYRHLPDDLRTVTDFTFSGFLFPALNSTDFAALCKDKNLGAFTLTFEQRWTKSLTTKHYITAY